MHDLNVNNFGIIIAYLIPGLIAVWGVGGVSPTLAALLVQAPDAQPSIAGFLYLTIVSLGVGVLTSTVRWILVDSIHHGTGLKRGDWDFSSFHEVRSGYDRLTTLHYDFYLFHANSLTALAFAYPLRRIVSSDAVLTVTTDLAMCLLLGVLFLGSRDNLRKYYGRLNQLMAASRQKPVSINPYWIDERFRSLSRHD
jgi:hypothetical protein